MLLCRLFVASGLTCSLLLGISLAEGQESGLQQPSTVVAAPLLRRVVINQHAFGDACNDAILDEQQLYIEKHVPNRPRVETAYDQQKVDEMSKALEDFWKERGIIVEVRTTLTPMPHAPRYAALKFEVYKR